MEEEWRPLCGLCINSKSRATKFCEVLGYKKGTILDMADNVTYAKNAWYLNTTFRSSDTWPTGGVCENDRPNNETNVCGKGQTALRINCTTPFFKNKKTSCT